MPTKRELLEEKTVKELKQMARDKDLSSYSRMRKAELTDLIESNYTKSEIESWPAPEEERPPEEAWPTLEEEIEVEELPGEIETREGEELKQAIVWTTIALIIFVVILVFFIAL